jgi:hypothetical protein
MVNIFIFNQNSHQAGKALSLAQISNVFIKPLVMEKNPCVYKTCKIKTH